MGRSPISLSNQVYVINIVWLLRKYEEKQQSFRGILKIESLLNECLDNNLMVAQNVNGESTVIFFISETLLSDISLMTLFISRITLSLSQQL